MIAIIAALPREIAGLVRGTKPDAAGLSQGIHRYRLPHTIVVAAGMGAERAAIAVASAFEAAGIEGLVSMGLAGACTTEFAPGTTVEATAVIDARTGERFHTSDSSSTDQVPRVLVTTASIASVQEKVRLAATYNAALVDMEAATVARLAVAHGVPFRAIKGISDAHDFELASLSRFAGKHGHFRTGAFALHTALRPHHWAKAAQLGRHSNAALTLLQEQVRGLVS